MFPSFPTRSPSRRPGLAAALVLALLAGCGNKGPLQPAPEAPPTTPPAQTEAPQLEDGPGR